MKLVNRFIVTVSICCLSIALTALAAEALDSGLKVGENAPAFDPTHVSGPDRGTSTCPMCKYGQGQGVMIWLNTDDLTDATAMAKRLEHEIQAKGLDKMRAFIVYMNPSGKLEQDVKTILADFTKAAGLKNVAVTYVPNPTDKETAGLYKINPDSTVKNTVLVYHKRTVVEKYVNMPATDAEMDRVVATIDRAAKSN